MSTNPGNLLSTYNYLVPAKGKTTAYMLSDAILDSTQVNFQQVGTDPGTPFNPSGVQIDNLAGTVPVEIVLVQTGFTISCPIGGQMGVQFPAPQGLTASITANGANIAFVDYPVIPYFFPAA